MNAIGLNVARVPAGHGNWKSQEILEIIQFPEPVKPTFHHHHNHCLEMTLADAEELSPNKSINHTNCRGKSEKLVLSEKKMGTIPSKEYVGKMGVGYEIIYLYYGELYLCSAVVLKN